MKVGDSIVVSGCVTQDKFIAGRTLAEIERILGFHPGRFSAGIAVAALTQLPQMQEFELAAYSNVATHRFRAPAGLDFDKLKSIARTRWAVSGPERLVKVFPTIRHNPSVNPDMQYPPGHGAPQWLLKVQLRARVAAVVNGYPNARYVPSLVATRP